MEEFLDFISSNNEKINVTSEPVKNKRQKHLFSGFSKIKEYKQKINYHIDFKEQTFNAKINSSSENSNFPEISLKIIDLLDFSRQDQHFTTAIIPKFEFQLRGFCDIFLHRNDKIDEEFMFLRKRNHSFLVQAHQTKDLYELILICDENTSKKALDKLLFLCILQMIDQDFVCFQIKELCIFEKNYFHLPFMEPYYYFGVLSPWEKRVSLKEYLISLLNQQNKEILCNILYDLCILLEKFFSKGFAFSAIDFQDFVIFIGSSGKIKLINPSNVFVFELSSVNTTLKFENSDVFREFLAYFQITDILFVEEISKFNYFCLVLAYFEITENKKEHYQLEFFSYLDENLKGQSKSFDNKILFSFLKNEKENVSQHFETKNMKHTQSYSFSSTNLWIFPFEFPTILNYSSKFDQIFIASALEFLANLVFFHKFSEALILIKNMQLLNLDIRIEIELFEQTSLLYLSNEEYDKGLEILEKSIAKMQKLYGSNLNEISSKFYYLTSLFHIKKNRFSEAIKTLETAEIPVKYKKETQLFFQVTYALAHLYKETNKNDKSFSYFKKLRKIIEENLPKESLIRRTYCEIHAMLYIQKHEYSTAISLLEEAVEIYKLRDENVDKNEKYSNILNSLGMCHFELRNPKQALFYYEKSIEIKGNLFAQNYENKGETLNNLALIYAELGNNKKAIEMNLKAIDIYTQNKEKACLANSLNNLGLAYKLSAEYENAIKAMTEALTIFQQEYGPLHLQVGKTLNNLGMTHYDKGETKKAIEFCEKALEIYKLFQNENPQAIGRTYNNLGILYSAIKNYEKALDYYENALDSKNQGDYQNQIDISYTLNNLSYVYYKLGKYDLALMNYKKVLEIRQKYFGDNHQYTVESIFNVGNCYYEKKNFKEAFNFYNKGHTILFTNDPQNLRNKFEYCEILEKTGICCNEIGNRIQSIAFFKEAISMETKIPINQEFLGILLKNLGFSLQKIEQNIESLKVLKESLEILKKTRKKTDPDIVSLKGEIKKIKSLLKSKKKNNI